MQLGQAVNTGRSPFLVLAAGGVVWIAAEHIVRRYMDQDAVVLLYGVRKVCDRIAVQSLGQFGVALGLVHVGIGGAVYHHLDVVVLHGLHDRPGIGDVQFGHVGEDIVVFGVRGGIAYAVAQLSVGTGY